MTSFGLMGHFNDVASDHDAVLAKEMNAKVARIPVAWANIEKQPGIFNWDTYDERIGALFRQGLRPLIILCTSPAWSRASITPASGGGNVNPEGNFVPPDLEHYVSWAVFCHEAANRYGVCSDFEIWNEPNYDMFWGGTPDAQVYADMLVLASIEIRKKSPSSKIVTAGMAPFLSTDSTKVDHRDYLSQVYQLAYGQPNCWDAVGLHPYPRKSDADVLQSVKNRINEVRAVRDQFGDVSRLWATEVGVKIGSIVNTGGQQRDELIRICEGTSLETLIVHRLRAKDTADEDGWELVKGDGTKRVSYFGLRDYWATL